MSQPIVFFDIAGPDDEALRNFYTTLFAWDFDDNGQFNAPVALPLQGAIRKDPAEKRIYIGVPDIEASLAQVFDTDSATVVPVDNPLTGIAGSNTIYVARRAGPDA